MLDSNAYHNFLLQTIKPFAQSASGGKEINCRCFYCPDSKNYRKGHFYIKTHLQAGEASTYYCQKCHASGIVTQSKLLEWGIYDPQIAVDLTLYNKELSKNPRNYKLDPDYIFKINNTYVTKDDLSKVKLDYINNRIGTNLSYEDCLNMKIVLNLLDLLKQNHIDQKQYTRHPNIIEQLDQNFVGFLSYDNAFLNMRNLELKEVYKSIDRRYVNYNIFDKVDNSHRFYTIPTMIDLTKPIRLNIAEGSFDILSIFYNMMGGDLNNNIYTSIGGSGYLGIIKFFIITKMIIDMEIHIYADNDIEQYKLDHIAKVLYPYRFPIYIHRNLFPGEKDFGVPKDRIKESVIKLN